MIFGSKSLTVLLKACEIVNVINKLKYCTMKKTVLLVVSASLLLNGCATMQPVAQSVKDTFESDDPCSNNARNIGITAGALLGAGLGVAISKATGGDGKKALATGAVLGAGLAGGAGWWIGKNIDKRRCELYKISQRYQIQLRSEPIVVNGGQDPIGLAITLPDKEQGGHFSSGSDVLTPVARKYFTDIARQYSVSIQLSQLPASATDNERQAIRSQLTNKKILLVGHTDDIGSSQLNADLSERRSRAVAALFREAGVPESNLLYQGAGETLPIAPNNTPEGRQHNRRVEIIDVNDETALQAYIASRRPNLAFYRSQADESSASVAVTPASPARTSKTKSSKSAALKGQATTNTSVTAVSSASGMATKPAMKSAPAKAASAARTVAKWEAGKEDSVDFGGNPVNTRNASLPIGHQIDNDAGFSLVGAAHAEDMAVLQRCNLDHPRISGAIRQLKDGKVYAKNEHIPGMYGTTWAEKVNGHLVVINRLSLLRDGAQVDVLPLVHVYKNYDPTKNKNPAADMTFTPMVNTYRGEKGILYRMFVGSPRNLQCMDVLLPAGGGREARNGLILYNYSSTLNVAPFQPKSL